MQKPHNPMSKSDSVTVKKDMKETKKEIEHPNKNTQQNERERIKEKERERVKDVSKDRVKDVSKDRVKDVSKDRVKDVPKERERVKEAPKDREMERQKEKEKEKEMFRRTKTDDNTVVESCICYKFDEDKIQTLFNNNICRLCKRNRLEKSIKKTDATGNLRKSNETESNSNYKATINKRESSIPIESSSKKV